MNTQYDAFAEDYEWIISDATLTGESHFEALRPILETLPPGSHVLDCACGTGILVRPLARRGYNVVGSDASEGMIRVARTRLCEENLAAPLLVCPWEQLPQEVDRKFALAICCGNAIGHCRDEAEMVLSFRAMREVLDEGGRLVLDTRNWGKLRADGTRYMPFGVRERAGRRCLPVCAWTFPVDPAGPIQVDVLFLFEQGGKVDLHVYPVTYYPFSADDLLARLAEAGFRVEENTYSADSDGYRVVVRRQA